MLRMERLAWLAAAGVLGLMAQPPARGGRGGAGGGRGGGEYLPYYQAPVVKGGPVGRTPEGKPDMQGYWTPRFNQSVYDVEDHPVARPGIPPGKGSIVDQNSLPALGRREGEGPPGTSHVPGAGGALLSLRR